MRLWKNVLNFLNEHKKLSGHDKNSQFEDYKDIIQEDRLKYVFDELNWE